VWLSEIRLPAETRIGEISRLLEKAEAHGGKICLPSSGKSKAEQLAEAGLSTSAANRYAAPLVSDQATSVEINQVAGEDISRVVFRCGLLRVSHLESAVNASRRLEHSP
jgi:hypothetical protein